jgi:photosystem II stability/assembly factor-like uncharacterized protein
MLPGGVQPFSLSTHPKQESVVYAATENGVQKSEDKGDTWKSLSPELEGGAVSVFAVSPDASYALVFSEKLGGLGKSTDDGKTWQKVNESFGGKAVLYVAYAKTQAVAYALTDSNALYKSTDAGETWSKIR